MFWAGWASGVGVCVCDCWTACSSCAIFWSKDCALAAIAAGGCEVDTGAGFFRTKMIAISDATRVAMLMMRSIFHFFMVWLERGERGGPRVYGSRVAGFELGD